MKRIIGYMVGAGYLVSAVAPTSQVLRSLRRKDTQDIALGWPILVMVALGMILPRVIQVKDKVLIFGHLLTMGANFVNLTLIVYYSSPPLRGRAVFFFEINLIM